MEIFNDNLSNFEFLRYGREIEEKFLKKKLEKINYLIVRKVLRYLIEFHSRWKWYG